MPDFVLVCDNCTVAKQKALSTLLIGFGKDRVDLNADCVETTVRFLKKVCNLRYKVYPAVVYLDTTTWSQYNCFGEVPATIRSIWRIEVIDCARFEKEDTREAHRSLQFPYFWSCHATGVYTRVTSRCKIVDVLIAEGVESFGCGLLTSGSHIYQIVNPSVVRTFTRWDMIKYCLERSIPLRMTTVSHRPPPEMLCGRLKPYQHAGYEWVMANFENGFGCCLADEMGLGKTVQSIAVMLELSLKCADLPMLVVAPTTVLHNWEKELERFAPSLRVTMYRGARRKNVALNQPQIILTSYRTLASDVDRFASQRFMVTIIDEAQNIKNHRSQTHKTIKRVNSRHVLALTGTPIENSVGDLWSIISVILPDYIPDRTQFIRSCNCCLPGVRNIVGPFVLRRKKKDHEQGLGDKVYHEEVCHMGSKQRELYDRVVNRGLAEVGQCAATQRAGWVFRLFNDAKKICNHPQSYDVLDTSGSCKMLRLKRLLPQLIGKTIIFTQYLAMGRIIAEMIRRSTSTSVGFLEGSCNLATRASMIERFQTDPETTFIVISLKAGGVGINLTEAQNVVHYDLWWNPAVENQATDRAHRIGQKNIVHVYRLIVTDTVENKISQLSKKKEGLLEDTIESRKSLSIASMSNEELVGLFCAR